MQTDTYQNLEELLPELTAVLKDAIQEQVLEIMQVDRHCSKFLKISELHPEIERAEFVIFSPHVRKSDHLYEHFIFVDSTGRKICHVSGAELALYGLVEPCTKLKKNPTGESEEDQKRTALRKA